MERGEQLWIQTDDGKWREATYEFRIMRSEPLGHNSVMLADGGGRRIVCGCKTSTVKPDGELPGKTDQDRKQAGEPWSNQEVLGLREAQKRAT